MEFNFKKNKQIITIKYFSVFRIGAVALSYNF